MKKKVNILETTLRDGSYAINFSFTSSDTSIICRQLEDAGFRYIEIGHGVGLNASKMGYGNSAETDEDYMIAADSVLKNAKYGMFCIPSIAKVNDLVLRNRFRILGIGAEPQKKNEKCENKRRYGVDDKVIDCYPKLGGEISLGFGRF